MVTLVNTKYCDAALIEKELPDSCFRRLTHTAQSGTPQVCCRPRTGQLQSQLTHIFVLQEQKRFLAFRRVS